MKLADIYINLINNNVEIALKDLKIYLKKLNKEKYRIIIFKLIEIDILEGDPAFIETMITLSEITEDNFTFNINKYISYFNEAIEKNKYEIAKNYLEILSQAKQLGYKISGLHSLNKKLIKIKPQEIREDYYGISISKVKQISRMIQKGITLEEACKSIKGCAYFYIKLALIFAKEFYYIEDFINGDLFLEKAKKQMEELKIEDTSIIEAILNNKYNYRNNQMHKSLLIYGYRKHRKIIN